MWECYDFWIRFKYFWLVVFGYKDKYKIYKVFNYIILIFLIVIGCIRVIVIFGLLNKVLFWC